MPDPSGVPILGNGHKHLADGGQEYAAELTTTDGGTHLLTMNFSLPVSNGAVDLAAAGTFDGEAQVMTSVSQLMTAAQLRLAPEPGQMPPTLVPVPGKRMVVLAHVVSFRYLGKVVEKTPLRIMVERPDGGIYIHYLNATDLGVHGIEVD